jgi:hypothetical protein
MFRQLFLIWIRSSITTEDMWIAFKDKMQTLLDWKALVTQWKVPLC